MDSKVALVTGGSRGIGRAICLELARSGYAVMINYMEDVGAAEHVRSMVEDEGGVAEVCQGDISAKSHRDLLISHTMQQYGRIDLLVNNAGTAPGSRKDILETEERSFDHVLNVNLKGPYFLTQRVAREMIELLSSKAIPSAAIINIGSIRAYTAAKNYGEYCISKAGMAMLTSLFAIRLAEHGINVYEVRPGIIDTDMTRNTETREFYNNRLASGMQPINRWGKPEEVAKAVGSIARGDLPFSTGAVIDVDGGWHIRSL